RDEAGTVLAPGEVGTVWFRRSEIEPFEYHRDPDKTESVHRGNWFTLGDMGYADEDGYLFLTGRSAELIISGGVNIYPQEVDNELMKHPAVLDVCTIGAPNDEWGEEVKSVVQLRPGFSPSPELTAELMGWARERLPRSTDGRARRHFGG